MNHLYLRTRAWLLAVLIVGVSLRAAAQDTWTQKADFGGRARQTATGFSIGSKGYLGTGFADDYAKDFWEYDPVADTWTQKADFGGSGRTWAVGFSIGSKGYIGTGAPSTAIKSSTKDFWEYDPAANTWTRKADFGGSGRFGAVGFSIGNKGYLGTGYDVNDVYTKDFWEYDPAADTWTRKADSGGTGRYGAVGFRIGSKGYLGTGLGDINGAIKDFWEYDPAADTWARKADFGGNERYGATGFGLGSTGYLGTGNDNNVVTNGATRDFWEYDPAADTWTRKADFGGSERYLAVSFSIGGQGYLGTGFATVSFDEAKDFWQYTPGLSCQAPTNVTVASITTTTASVSFDGSSTASGGYTVNYTPYGSLMTQSVAGSASPVVLTGLIPNTAYIVTVASNCAGTRTATSTDVSFFTLCEVPVLAAPASQTVAASAGQCGASVAFAASATGNPAPIITYALPSGQVITSPYVFPIGTTTVRATASSCGGTDSKTFSVTVTGTTLAPPIIVTPANTTYTGGVATTLYLGYGPQSVTLTASGGTSYQWSPATGLSSTTIANPVFTATQAGTFTYTVTATSACTATRSVTLTVVDARCGNKLDRVVVCHNGNLLCLGADGVAAHLKHGDPLGTCSGKAQTSVAATTAAPEGAPETSTSFDAYPNPFTSSTTLRFRAAQAGPVQLQVYNALGQLVTTLYNGQVQAGQVVERTLDGTGLSTGLYTCRFATPSGEHFMQRIVLTK